MRCITSPTSCPHRPCQRSQQIEALAYTDLTQCNNHYQRRHLSIATDYDLLLSCRQQAPHREQDQRRLPAPLPRLRTTPDVPPEEIVAALPHAASNIPTLTMAPHLPTPQHV